MISEIKHILDPSCPWYPLKVLRLPKVKWCEEQLCAWIEEPANAWSNLGYILLGLLMWHLGRDLKSRALKFYGPASIIVGVGSFVYHASNNFIFQIFDFFGMYVFCYLLIFINLERLGKKVIKKSFKLYWGVVLLTTFITVVADFTKIPIQGLVFVLILAIITTELLAKKKSTTTYKMLNFYLSVIFMLIAAIFSVLDHQRLLCDPTDHFVQGHAIWHMFGSFALLFSFFHHRQFDNALSS
jgi:hypothetical protein